MAEIRPIRSPEDHAAALAEARTLIGAAPGSPEADRLSVLTILIEDYERRTLRQEPATPLDVLRLEMALKGRTQAELAQIIGSRSRASEILSGQRALTPSMADRIAEAWGVPRDLLGPLGDGARLRNRIAAAAAVGAVALGGAGALGYAAAVRDLPSVEPLVAAASADAETPLETIPAHVRQAFLAAEDSDFYRHDGTSGRGLIRASVDNVLNIGRGVRPAGGGTITQQVVKMTLLKDEGRTLERKVRQIALGADLEQRLSKDEIFELYLNQLYFGNGTIGIRAAALRYFGVEPADLTVPQAATLAAMPSAPNHFRIDRAENLERAHERRNWVLARMSDEGYLSHAAFITAERTPLTGPDH